MSETKVYRSRFLAVGIAVWAVVLLVAGLATVEANRSGNSTTTQVLGVIAYIALVGFMLLRMARARLCVRPDGVLVVNYIRSRFISWHEITEFSLRGWGYGGPPSGT